MKNWPRLQVLHVLGCFFFISLGWTLVDSAGVPGIAPASAATRLVSTSGMDAGNCMVTPCRTIQFAVDVASPGDTIFALPGTYNENILVTKPDLTLRGSGASSTTISGDATANVVYAFGITSFSIEGFTVRNAGQGGNLPGSAAIHLNPNVSGALGNWIVRGNILQDNGFGIALWNSLGGGNALIENNLISNNHFNGISNDGHPQITIRNNTIVDNGWFGYTEFVGAADNFIVNNIIASNGSAFASSCSECTCATGILVSHIVVGYPFNYYISFNDVFNNAIANYGQNTGSGCIAFVPSPGTGEISADPEFQDAAHRNYRLTIGSPAIDEGTNDNSPAADLDGKTRPIDGDGDGIAAVDMGAFELTVRSFF
jgi:hypothetical protein